MIIRRRTGRRERIHAAGFRNPGTVGKNVVAPASVVVLLGYGKTAKVDVLCPQPARVFANTVTCRVARSSILSVHLP